ncbi:MAG: CHASE2 domain-containing protein [Pseudohongiellaceae bacterium]
MLPSQLLMSLGLDRLSAIHKLKPSHGRFAVLLFAALLSFFLFAFFKPALVAFEERLGALGWVFAPDFVPEDRVPLVVIDERSLAEVGPWPWTRAQMASLVTAIDEAGAQLQLHDIVFPEAKVGDEQLLAAIEASSGVILAQIPNLQSGQSTKAGLLSHPLVGISCSGSATPILSTTSSYLAPASSYSAVPKGHIALNISGDGTVRKAPALVCIDGQVYPSLALAAFFQSTTSTSWQATITPGSGLFAPEFILQLRDFPGLDIPLDSEGNMRISFAKAPSAFNAIPAVDVINGTADLSLLENQWVLVGGTAFGMGDIVPTPYAGAAPGVELHVRMLGSLLDFEIPYTPASAGLLQWLLCGLFALAMFFLASANKDRLTAYGLPAFAIVLPAVALLLHISLLRSANLWLGWALPGIFSCVAASLLLLLEQSRVRLERGRVYGNLNSYLPNEVAREIAFNAPNSNISAKRREVTLLSADLRNFSAFGEARAPEESAAVLHFFFTKATEIIELNGGRVHEFKGDSLLAVWEGHHQHAATKALDAATALQQQLADSLLTDFAPEGLEPLALGIGIEQGPALIGSIGPAHRRSHTLLGDTVVITLRIQEMTADLAQPILVGECAARQLTGFGLESQGSYLLDGLKTPHVLFAPENRDSRVTDPTVTQSSVKLKVINGGQH